MQRRMRRTAPRISGATFVPAGETVSRHCLRLVADGRATVSAQCPIVMEICDPRLVCGLMGGRLCRI